MSVKKFKIDDVVLYEPFKNDETINSEILKNISPELFNKIEGVITYES